MPQAPSSGQEQVTPDAPRSNGSGDEPVQVAQTHNEEVADTGVERNPDLNNEKRADPDESTSPNQTSANEQGMVAEQQSVNENHEWPASLGTKLVGILRENPTLAYGGAFVIQSVTK